MSEYRIFETDRFQRDVAAIAHGGEKRVLGKLRGAVYQQLRSQPRFGPQIKKLRGFVPETWRYRIGAWRFFYEVRRGEGRAHDGRAPPQLGLLSGSRGPSRHPRP